MSGADTVLTLVIIGVLSTVGFGGAAACGYIARRWRQRHEFQQVQVFDRQQAALGRARKDHPDGNQR